MDEKKLKNICIYFIVIVAVSGILFFAVAHRQMNFREETTDSLTPSYNVGELTSGMIIEQDFTPQNDTVKAFSVIFQTFMRENHGSVTIEILDGENVLYQTETDLSSATENEKRDFCVSPELTGVKGKKLTLRLTVQSGESGSAATVAYGNSIAAGRAEIGVATEEPLRVNGEEVNGQLCMTVTTVCKLWFGSVYWYFYGAGVLLSVLYSRRLLRYQRRDKSCRGLAFLNAVVRYRFLISQLVNRDFRTRYKRSVLGMFWSFLNPLLSMLVQYVIFSTIFQSNIPHYPAYLLTGIVCFNYFSETAGLCLTSITSNSSLLTKVYMPKYIFPLTRALSSGINLLLSLIPLAIVVLATGLRLRASMLLLPIWAICLFSFSLGIGLLLSSSMVFFRDTQFLWGVFSMLWMYMTPIFYPDSIIPTRMMGIYKLNPMFHILRLFRALLIDGASPEPKAYLFCFIAAFVPLLIGLVVFKKTQDRFILYV